MNNTTKLSLPYIMPAQAQKHVTHNEALVKLDALVQLCVISQEILIPPEMPEEADAYIIPTDAEGAWENKETQIASWFEGAWNYYTPVEGWRCWDQATQTLIVFDGNVWIQASQQLDDLEFLGVNTNADMTNRLAVKSDAVLLSHDDVTPGNGSIRLVLNKGADVHTASLLFQNQFEGRAEIGIGTDDAFSFKTSDDGISWIEALNVSLDTGEITLPNTSSRLGINTNTPSHSTHIKKSEEHKTEAAFAMTGWGRQGAAPADEEGVGLYLNYNQPGNRQFALCDTLTGAGVRFFGNSLDAITNFGNRADIQIGTNTHGAHVGQAILNTQFSVSNNTGTPAKVVFEVGGALDQTGDLLRVTTNNASTSGDAMSIKANGNAEFGASITLASYQVAALPTDVPSGSLAYCTDVLGGAQPVYFDGTDWRRVRDGVVV